MRRRAGFTLLELVVVIAILGLLAGLAIPRIAGTVARRRAEAAAVRIMNDIKHARRAAVAASTERKIVFDPTQNSYVLEDVTSAVNNAALYRVHLDRAPYGAALRYANFDGKLMLTFDGYGTPSADGMVVVGAGAHAFSVIVDAETGEAEYGEGDARKVEVNVSATAITAEKK
jgi:prepilin-type N-terminal cleavage/methylation domain-containing protein